MNIDLPALPDDVETLQALVRSLAAERTSLTEARAEIERLALSSRSYSVASSAGAPNGSMRISSNSASTT